MKRDLKVKDLVIIGFGIMEELNKNMGLVSG